KNSLQGAFTAVPTHAPRSYCISHKRRFPWVPRYVYMYITGRIDMTSRQLKNPYGFFAPYIPLPKGRGFTARLVN
ncbi:MAG: hypothetical protein LBD29_06140, partial [Treponema sp.]|nr:hypothetical protein [Treponema sp.]